MHSNNRKIPPLHPGVVLQKEFMEPLKLSQNRLARDLGVPPRRINEIVNGKRAITADTALRLALYFGNSPDFWLGLQTDFELDNARDRLFNKLKREVKPAANRLPEVIT